METTTSSKKMVLAGKIISVLCVLFLVMDGGMKVFKAKPSMDGSALLGWPLSGVQGIGALLLVCTALYIIPRTAVLGAILITAYLGGATAIMVRADQPFFFPIVFGVFVWAGLYFRNEKLRRLVPVIK
ncbi:MAG: DoxX family protein [Bacteroidota bacterium]